MTYRPNHYRREPGNGPTERQRSYLRSLRESVSAETFHEVQCAVFGTNPFTNAPNTPREVTRSQMSHLIDLLKRYGEQDAHGHAPDIDLVNGY